MESYDFVKNTLDQIPQAAADARRIVGLVKENGRITGYQLWDWSRRTAGSPAISCLITGLCPKLRRFPWQSRGKSPGWALPTGETRSI